MLEETIDLQLILTALNRSEVSSDLQYFFRIPDQINRRAKLIMVFIKARVKCVRISHVDPWSNLQSITSLASIQLLFQKTLSPYSLPNTEFFDAYPYSSFHLK